MAGNQAAEAMVRDYRAPEDDAGVKALWHRVFPNPAAGIAYEALFRDGPLGPLLRSVGELEGQVVGHAGVIPLAFQVLGREERGAYSVAAMTDAAARGRGLYTGVARHLYERLERSGFAFVGGFSNSRSVRVNTGPLGRTPLRPFPWAVRPVWPWDRVTAPEAPELEDGVFGHAALDGLWKRVAPVIRIGGVRDAAFNRWRFTGRAPALYRMRWVRADQEVLGYCVGRIMTYRGVKAAFLADFLVDPAALEAGRALLRDFRHWAARSGAWLLSALRPWHSPMGPLLREAGFVRVPEKLHPHRLCFSMKPLGRHADRAEMQAPANWFLTWADLDIV